ncbi:MAG: BREX-1 system adenine-specific DNA-methyltransferase PglX, partial [Candidatus Atribacteria bacterium]|nr:BREX-1 system adenine-specific DNA-methyltransferase PglX [Candidatus Atribacteria bacterium]
YGVDIDPGAVEIAKLRLWLSLIVDEEDINKIKPLPNLDYKIMQGNSLISEFVGIDLDENKESDESIQLSFTDEIKGLYDRLKIRKDELLNQSDVGEKKILKNEIENLIIKIFEIKLQEQKSDYFKKIRKIEEKWEQHPVKEQREKEIEKEKDLLYRKTGFNLEEVEKQLRQYTSNQEVRPFFPWKLYFSEIFQEKDGFDVVIANPPYGNLLDLIQKKSMKNNYSFSTFSDISSPFIEKSFNLLKNNGNLVFIITYAITFNKNFSKNRELIANGFRDNYIYTFDRDKCRIFKSMSQSVSILKCFNKRSKQKEGIFTSKFFRDTPNIYNIKLHNCDNFLLPKNSKYSQVHRLPKIGEDSSKQILIKLLRFQNIVKTIIINGDSKIWIRTSGNYWYNAFDRKPYESV